MPAGRRLLEDLGLKEPITSLRARDFRTIRFHLPGNGLLELDLTETSDSPPGWVLSRDRLDNVLARFAAAQPGVEFRDGARLQGCLVSKEAVHLTVQAEDFEEHHSVQLLIGADGIRSRFRASHGIRRLNSSRGRFALRRLYGDFENREEAVNVHCSQHGEAYVAPFHDGQARVTLLVDTSHGLSGEGAEQFYESMLEGFPSLRSRLARSRPLTGVEATSPVSTRLSRCHGERLILVGDAAGAVDPITGQGMTIALRDAHLAANIATLRLAEGCLSAEALCDYTSAREEYFVPSYQLARQLLALVRRPWLARRAATALRRSPSLRHKLMGSAIDPHFRCHITRLDSLRLLCGL